MSKFMSEIVVIDEILEHPNAHSLEIAKIGDYQSIVSKGLYKAGDLVCYLQTDTIMPDALRDQVGVAKNRVRPVKLRGILSEGICIPLQEGWELGQDVSEQLGTVKYEPPESVYLRGNNIRGAHRDKCISYDFENIKKVGKQLFYSDDNEPLHVAITEKIHGTWVQFGLFREDVLPDQPTPWLVITSKGRAHKGFVLDQNDTNVYSKMGTKMLEQLTALRHDLLEAHPLVDSFVLMGEIYGNGVQDLNYGLKDVKFKAFDLAMCSYAKNKGTDTSLHVLGYMNKSSLQYILFSHHIGMVPVHYWGPYLPEIVKQLTDGPSALTEGHVKEGVIVSYESDGIWVMAKDNDDPRHGRRIAKSVAEAYLLRKKGTENQ